MLKAYNLWWENYNSFIVLDNNLSINYFKILFNEYLNDKQIFLTLINQYFCFWTLNFGFGVIVEIIIDITNW
jgi:hypothetical protein